MARPLWNGILSFGLLNLPVALMPGERRVDLHFRLLDARDRKPIRYERVNTETGDEVPWKDIVKAFEYSKGNYVVLEEDDLRAAAPESHETVEVERFVDAGAIPPNYFDKPYVLVPARKAEKGYVLLRETLKKTGKVGIARVVIRTREHLAAVMPQGDALLLMLLRYPQEVIDPAEYPLPTGKPEDYRVSARELDMAAQLVASMSGPWQPDEYQDEFHDRLRAVIEKKMKASGAKTALAEETPPTPEHASTNVVDFVSLLKRSLAEKGSAAPAKRATKTAAKAPAKRAARSPTKATPGRRTGSRSKR